ncbi:metallophosphoesterase [Saccharomonospora azurea]|uniref:metallophosphoesterase n=1 Tax=Saccharomonospora azurea TaxID=40988 RepID=UPI003D89D0CE
MRELAFIGDIHGCLKELDEVVQHALPRTGNLIFLGDYVNRGLHSREVIDYLINLDQASETTCTFLRGNHDEVFLDCVTTGNIDTILRMGGATTIASYVRRPEGDIISQLKASIPDAHLQFLHNLTSSMETEYVYAAHAPRHGLEHDNETKKYCIYGHRAQSSGIPLITETHAIIDTGCGTTDNGRLTCLFWPSLDWVQSKRR